MCVIDLVGRICVHCKIVSICLVPTQVEVELSSRAPILHRFSEGFHPLPPPTFPAMASLHRSRHAPRLSIDAWSPVRSPPRLFVVVEAGERRIHGHVAVQRWHWDPRSEHPPGEASRSATRPTRSRSRCAPATRVVPAM